MKHFAVIGHPIGHSLSPLMHNTAFKLLGLDCNYQMMDISPESLKQEIQQFKESKWGGFNVTIPHKESIMPLLDEVIPDARAIGAVNTVVNRNNKLIGYNTDVIGVEMSLDSDRRKIEGKMCTILGSGGVARSVAYVLIHNIKPKAVTFSALIPEQAHALIKSLGSSDVRFDVINCKDPVLGNAIKDSVLIVNATDVGMFPHVKNSPLPDKGWISANHIIFDLIYRPLVTQLQIDAKAAGAKTIDGLGMFIQQGAAAFKLWTEKDMPVGQVRQELEKKLTSD
ncbi:MAG: shikimate dehydrogenase [Bacteroidetes bacterium]|nr:shikimate dehydrogenase [Bacteroidota bacterium]